MQDGKRLLTSSEVASMFSVAEPTIWRWARNNTLPVIRIGQRMRFDPVAIERHIAAVESGDASRGGAEPQAA